MGAVVAKDAPALLGLQLADVCCSGCERHGRQGLLLPLKEMHRLAVLVNLHQQRHQALSLTRASFRLQQKLSGRAGQSRLGEKTQQGKKRRGGTPPCAFQTRVL